MGNSVVFLNVCEIHTGIIAWCSIYKGNAWARWADLVPGNIEICF